VQQRLPPSAEIGGAGAQSKKVFLGAADRLHEAATDVVAW
jgi:hypothetical protein